MNNTPKKTTEEWRERFRKRYDFSENKTLEYDNLIGIENFIFQELKIRENETRSLERKRVAEEIVGIGEGMKKEYCKEDVFLEKNKPYDWHGYSHALSHVIAKVKEKYLS